MKQYTIGQVAKLTGLSSKAIRFYEEKGVIHSSQRRANGYRIYSEKDKERLYLIKKTRDAGLPLEKIKLFVKGCQDSNCAHTKEYFTKEIAAYTQVLDAKMQELQRLKTRLELLSKKTKENKPQKDCAYCCDILEQLVSLEEVSV